MIPKPKAKVSRPAEDGSSDEWGETSKGKSRKVGSSNATAGKSMSQRPKRKTVEKFEDCIKLYADAKSDKTVSIPRGMPALDLQVGSCGAQTKTLLRAGDGCGTLA